jgi:WD40 repeat protein
VGLYRHTLSRHTGGVTALALSVDGRHALSGSRDRTLRWWDVASEKCLHTLARHTGGVTALALSVDGRCRMLEAAPLTEER